MIAVLRFLLYVSIFTKLIYCLNPYYSYDKIDSTLQEWKTQFGSVESQDFPGNGVIFQLDTIGYSSEFSLPIFAVKISDNAPQSEDEVKVLILGQCHAEEVYGVEISMAIIDCFLNPNSCYQNQYIKSNFSQVINKSLEDVELWVIPTHNPDGLKVVHGFFDDEGNWVEDPSYRKNISDVNENGVFDWTAGIGQDSDGVDLNRNYDINWQFGDTLQQKTSSCNPYYNDDYDYYKGSYPFSESETKAIRDFAIGKNFTLSIAYHSSRSGCVAEKIIFPWGWKEKGNLDEYRKYSPDYSVINSLAGQMNTILGFSSSEGIKPQGSRTGNAHDWLYKETGCIQYLIEVGAFNYGADGFTDNDLLIDEVYTETIEKNLGTFFYLMMTAVGANISLDDQIIAHALLSGLVSDNESGLLIENAEIKIEELHSDVLKPRLTNGFGRFYRILDPQEEYTLIVSAEGYQSDTLYLPPLSAGLTTKNIALEKLNTYSISWENQSSISDGNITITIIGENMQKNISGLSTLDLTEGLYSITISSPGFVPQHITTHILENRQISFDLLYENPIINESFDTENQWEILSGDWIISDGMLLSQYGAYYSNNRTNTIQFLDKITANKGDVLIIDVQMKYETEWENDRISFDYVSNNDTINIITLSGGYYLSDQYYFTFTIEQGMDSGFLFLSLNTDYNLTYRGLALDHLKIHLDDGESLLQINSMNKIPEKGRLAQNFPNPFNPVTTIHYTPSQPTMASLNIYNLQGVFVREILNYYHTPGDHSIQISSNLLSSGIYFYRLETKYSTTNRKFVILK